MNSINCKNIIKSSLCSMALALAISSTFFTNIKPAYTQTGPLLPGYMSCQSSSLSDVDFGDIDLVNPVQGRIAVKFQPLCDSSYYNIYTIANGQTAYQPTGRICIGIASVNPIETREERYLYLKGDVTSKDKLPFNFFFSPTGSDNFVGDGMSTAGIVSSGVGQEVTLKPAEGEKRSVPIPAVLYAGFNFENKGLPVGVYSNKYKISIWTGVGANSPTSSICSASFPEKGDDATIEVKVHVLPSCEFRIIDQVNFGQHTQLSSSITATGKLGVTCNNNASYEIQLNGGRSKDINNRTMSLFSNGAYNDNEKISYNLFLPNSNVIWGQTKGENTYQATSPDFLLHTIEVKASINPGSNPRPKIGIYMDTVAATIIY